MLRRKNAALDMGSPTVFKKKSIWRAIPNALLSVPILSMLALPGPAEAAGQRGRETVASSSGTSAATPPMVIEATAFGDMHDGATPATIRVRLLDLGALTPSAFGDWETLGADHSQK